MEQRQVESVGRVDSSMTKVMFDSQNSPGTGLFLSRKSKMLIIVMALISLILFIIGVVLIATARKKCQSNTSGSKRGLGGAATENERCKFSEEARRVGLKAFLKKVKDNYYRLHPEKIGRTLKSTADDIRKKYIAYDPSPQAIKQRTDTAYQLFDEIKGKVSGTN